ncbi:MAG: hypothetical protein MJ252_09460, partial [archaeon]|nr:hypothetical protein [archaeon]
MNENEELQKLLKELSEDKFGSEIKEDNIEDLLNEANTPKPKEDKKDSLKFLTKNEDEYQKTIEQAMQSGIGDSMDALNSLSFEQMCNNIEKIIDKPFSDFNKENEKEKRELNIPHFNNPLDFIDYMERNFLQSQLEKNENIFQLKNYNSRMNSGRENKNSEEDLINYPSKNNSNLSISALKFIQKSVLTSRLFKKDVLITSICSQDNLIFVGNNLGKIGIYLNTKEIQQRTLENQEISYSEKKSVVSMSASKDNDFLVSGYLNGFVALWEIDTGKCRYLIKDIHVPNCVIAVKFLSVEKKYFEIISSDMKGNVNKIVISEGFFSSSVTYSKIIEHRNPIFIIEIMSYSKEEISKFEKKRIKIPTILALGCLSYVMVYQIFPEVQNLLRLDRPEYIKTILNKYFVPDADFGFGYLPQRDIIISQQNNINNFEEPNLEEDETEKEIPENHKTHHLFALAWEKIIYLFSIIYDEEFGLTKVKSVGHYVNNYQILRVSFISHSVLLIYDSHKYFSLINTKLLKSGNVSFDNKTHLPNYIPSDLTFPEVENRRIIDEDILFQTYIPDRAKGSKELKATYNNLIIGKNNKLFFLGKNSFYYADLLPWNKILIELSQSSEWLSAFCLGLDLYHGRKISLPELPIEEKKRKEEVAKCLRTLILQYVGVNINSYNNSYSSADTKKKKFEEITSCINISIELCLEINDFNYLLNQIQPIFDENGLLEVFFEKLEPFILCNKIHNQDFGQVTVSKIVQMYLVKEKYQILSQVLTHLDTKCIDTEEMKGICMEHNLLTPLIFIYINGEKPDYFFPLNKIYELFLKRDIIDKKKFGKFYTDYMLSEDYKSYELEMSKQYIGHKLLWYINMCLDGIKFPNKDIIPEDTYYPLIEGIFLWLLKSDVMDNILMFDSFSYFVILYRFFAKEKCLKIISNINYDSVKAKGIKLKNQDIINFELKTFIDAIIEKCQKLNEVWILYDMNEFLIKISLCLDDTLMKSISYEVFIEAAKFLFDIQKHINHKHSENKKEETGTESSEGNEQLIDFFNLHNFTEDYDSKIVFLSKEINQMLNCWKSKMEEKYLDDLLKYFIQSNSPLVLVKICLYNLLENYSACLETFLSTEKIENKIRTTYNFINKNLQNLKQNQK